MFDRAVSDEPGLSGPEKTFLLGIEKILDAAMETLPAGDVFLYGINQSLSPGMVEALTRRYLAAGWADAEIVEGETGAFEIYLRP